jgi:hypothetical protein
VILRLLSGCGFDLDVVSKKLERCQPFDTDGCSRKNNQTVFFVFVTSCRWILIVTGFPYIEYLLLSDSAFARSIIEADNYCRWVQSSHLISMQKIP